MIIYPAIDLKDKMCVRLSQGSFDRVTVYESDPLKLAQRWERKGASYLHLVDLDGARNGIRINEGVVKDILKTLTIPLQLGGGIRNTESVEAFFKLGVERLIIGTAALKNMAWTREMIETYKGKILVSIDARKGYVASHGWEKISNIKAIDLIKELEGYGLERIVYTDIEKDGMLEGPNFQIYEEVKKECQIEIIASGGITSLADVKKLKAMGIHGAIIGKALYDGKIDLGEVLKCQKLE